MLISVVLIGIVCFFSTTIAVEQSTDNKINSEGKYLNYLRLKDGECHNCSTYKCTNSKENMGGSEWCIMLFPAALAHCDADPNCGGYTMTTAEWFHTKYDKNGQVAVHLAKAGQKPINCSYSEWSSYEKQNSIRDTPVIYGRSTCANSGQETCDQSRNFNYIFVSNSNVASNSAAYLCKNHPRSLDNKDHHCVLPIADGITYCNSDDQCGGFMIDTDNNWQKKLSQNGMQVVQLFSKGVTYTASQTWRTFEKQQ